MNPVYVEQEWMGRGQPPRPRIVEKASFCAAHVEEYSTINPATFKISGRHKRNVPDRVATGKCTHEIKRGKVPTLRIITCPVVLARLEQIAVERQAIQERLKQLRDEELAELNDGYRRGVPADVEPIKEATEQRRREREAKQAAERAT
jgi:hypothetical protein